MNFKTLLTRFIMLSKLAQRYLRIIALIIAVAAYGFMIHQIQAYSAASPPQDDLTLQQIKAKSPLIDKQAVEKIQQLKSTNVQVHALFEHARDNPFPSE